ncbi:hypothetical protein BJY16_007557 [Actinoplanes octamycinicus]|uniref:DUF4397 domain-containing protein n=1 Tax=Actinoplanes octamycinicus TaxID=135948 RepID=A0A7W7H550_9ACTN|nr:DUF4397 domain-containing protein [Actinoplanes octamycinicus]MBB4744098.1 hypothetical protein [Actinoplanes octamycinicus]GIE56944.1 hypothetical protein Aoc01nite_23460 [Actinoplanes octamycinicus]
MRILPLGRAAAVGAVTLLALGGFAGFSASPANAAANSKVSVVHGIPGQPVDVYVNGKKTIPDFQPGKVAGPLDLPAGKYDIALTKPGDALGSALLKVDDAEVPGDANISLVAHLDEGGKPTLTPFVNDTGKLGAGQARLIVRHTAAAPAVDIRAGGKPVFQDVTNGKEGKADLPAGSVSADVVLAGTSTRVLGPADLDLAEGTATIVYAVGSAEDKTLDLVSQEITGLHSAPGGVPSGDGGRADGNGSLPWYGIGGVGILLAALGLTRLVTARR